MKNWAKNIIITLSMSMLLMLPGTFVHSMVAMQLETLKTKLNDLKGNVGELNTALCGVGERLAVLKGKLGGMLAPQGSSAPAPAASAAPISVGPTPQPMPQTPPKPAPTTAPGLLREISAGRALKSAQKRLLAPSSFDSGQFVERKKGLKSGQPIERKEEERNPLLEEIKGAGGNHKPKGNTTKPIADAPVDAAGAPTKQERVEAISAIKSKKLQTYDASNAKVVFLRSQVASLDNNVKKAGKAIVLLEKKRHLWTAQKGLRPMML